MTTFLDPIEGKVQHEVTPKMHSPAGEERGPSRAPQASAGAADANKMRQGFGNVVAQVLGPKLASQNIATKVQWMACRGYPEEGYGLWTAWEMLPSSMQSSPPSRLRD